jgi:uncharacterized membrane protein
MEILTESQRTKSMSNKDPNSNELIKFLQRTGGWITAVIGFLTALITFSTLIIQNTKDNKGALIVVLLISAIGIVFLSCVYIYFKKEPGTIIKASRKPSKRNKYPKKYVGLLSLVYSVSLLSAFPQDTTVTL